MDESVWVVSVSSALVPRETWFWSNVDGDFVVDVVDVVIVTSSFVDGGGSGSDCSGDVGNVDVFIVVADSSIVFLLVLLLLLSWFVICVVDGSGVEGILVVIVFVVVVVVVDGGVDVAFDVLWL